MKKYCMGIDIGSYESKSVITDSCGAVIAYAARKHELETPRDGWFEHDAERVWWGDFCVLSKELLEMSGISPGDISCVGASTLGSDCLAVDEQCRPLRKAILYGIDSRAQEEIAYLRGFYGEAREKELFGRPIITGDVAPKILWLKNHEPEVYRKAYKFLTGSSYVVAKLTGNYVLDRFLSRASFRPLYKEDGGIDEAECALYCRPDQLAETRAVTDIAGHVTAQASVECGLAEGTPVITGTGDSTAEAISTGVLDPGDIMLQFGSSLFIYCCTDHLVEDNRVRGNSFTIPGRFSIAAGTNTAGTLTRWYRDNLYFDYLKDGQDEAFTRMAEELGKIPPGSDGLITLPYFAGERTPINDPNARGMVIGLKLSHTRGHLYRSALEGIGFSAAQHLDIFCEHGIKSHRIMTVGGGTKNRPWMQLVADIIGQEIHIAAVNIGASYGDALMAGIGIGMFKDFSALHDVIKISTTLKPDPERHIQYQKYYELFNQLYAANKEYMHQL